MPPPSSYAFAMDVMILYDNFSLFRSSIGAEAIRFYEHITHKTQTIADVDEQIFCKLLDDLEDFEVDEYYRKLGLASAAREDAQIKSEAEQHEQNELRGQDIVLTQLQNNADRKRAANHKQQQEQDERLLIEEKMRYDNYREKYDEHLEKLKTRDFLLDQKKNNYMDNERRDRILREKSMCEDWAQHIAKEKQDAASLDAEKKVRTNECSMHKAFTVV